jgi:hypothetical protein
MLLGFCCRAESDFPSSFDISFRGISRSNPAYIQLELSNGTTVTAKEVSLNFSMTYKGDDTYAVHISVQGDSFLSDATVFASVVDEHLVVDSMKSIFKINPQLLNQSGNFVLAERSDYNIVGKVIAPTGKALTTMPDTLVRAIMVESFHVANNTSQRPLILGYDPASGVVVNAGPIVSDILLKKIGIDFISGGAFQLVSFSNTLNLELIPLSSLTINSTSNSWYTISLLIAIPAVFVGVIVLFLLSRKKRSRKIGDR